METDIKNFLNSDLVESEYYNLPKEDLINLKQYILMIKEKEKEFQRLVEQPVKSMQEKCNWLAGTNFQGIQSEVNGEFILHSIILWGVDNINLVARYKDKLGKYVGLVEWIPKIYLLNKRIRTIIKRQNDLNLIQGELGDVASIGQTIYDGLFHKYSISENFSIIYLHPDSIAILNNHILLAKYLDNQHKSKDKELLNNEEKQKLLTKIQIRNN